MSMHLVGPYMTTTKYNSKKKAGKKTAKQLKAEADHEKYLRKMGVHPDQLEAKAKRNPQGKRLGIHDIPDYRSDSRNTVPTSDQVAGHGTAREANTYSGERVLLGVATMHKSNMVPIFADKKEDAKDIASMRR